MNVDILKWLLEEWKEFIVRHNSILDSRTWAADVSGIHGGTDVHCLFSLEWFGLPTAH
jgi:hypothetical protein